MDPRENFGRGLANTKYIGEGERSWTSLAHDGIVMLPRQISQKRAALQHCCACSAKCRTQCGNRKCQHLCCASCLAPNRIVLFRRRLCPCCTELTDPRLEEDDLDRPHDPDAVAIARQVPQPRSSQDQIAQVQHVLHTPCLWYDRKDDLLTFLEANPDASDRVGCISGALHKGKPTTVYFVLVGVGALVNLSRVSVERQTSTWRTAQTEKIPSLF